jgi:hypothetical protein
MLKTCAEIGASMADCRRWRATDTAFNDQITYIERERKSLLREASNCRKKRMVKKLLPYLIAIIVIIVGCFAVKTCKEQKEAKQEAERKAKLDSMNAAKDIAQHENDTQKRITEQAIADAKKKEAEAKIKEEENKKKEQNPLKPPKGGRRVKSIPEWEPEMFERLWRKYPRGEKRTKAVEEWDKLRPDRKLMKIMSAALDRMLESDEWRRGYAPYLCTWLHQRRWEDDLSRLDAASSEPEPEEDDDEWLY